MRASHDRTGARRWRAMWAGRIARAAFILTLELCVAVVLVSLIRATPSAPADEPTAPPGADAVVNDPGSFGGGEIAVQGRIVERPARVCERDRRAFVLAGPRGRRLLIVAAKDAKLPFYREGVAVAVHGTVVVPPDNERLLKAQDDPHRDRQAHGRSGADQGDGRRARAVSRRAPT